MLKVLMEYRKGVLFVRIYGSLNINTIKQFDLEVKEVIIEAGIKNVVLNIENIAEIDKDGIKRVKELKKIMKKFDGKFFLFGGEIKELSTLVNLENELNVFRKVVI